MYTKWMMIVTAAMALTVPVTAQRALGDFHMELAIPLAGVSSASTPNLPPELLQALGSGVLQLRQRLDYSSARRQVQQVAFVVPGGATPMPAADWDNSYILADKYVIAIDKAVLGPDGVAVLAGRVASNENPTPFGDVTGTSWTMSFLTSGGGAGTKFVNLSEAMAGKYSIFAAGGIGTLGEAAAQACSLSTIQGTYLFRMSGGAKDSNGVYQPIQDYGRWFVDGQGGGYVIDDVRIGDQGAVRRKFNISYTLDADCSGVMTLQGGVMRLETSRDGNQVQFVFTAPTSWVAAGSGTRD